MKNKYYCENGVCTIECNHKGNIVNVLISESDLPIIDDMPNTWGISPDGRGRMYCVCYITAAPCVRKKFYLHHFLLKDDVLVVDHINTDPLDNQRENLRLITHQQNTCNKKSRDDGTTRGVYPTPSGKWMAKVGHNLKETQLGTFSIKQDAIDAVVAFRKKHWGI